MNAPAIEPPAMVAYVQNNEYKTPEMQQEYADFLNKHPEWFSTMRLDVLRTTEYSRLDQQKQVYLDYTGSSLFAASQVNNHLNVLFSGVYGNPHSHNPTSTITAKLVQEARSAVLNYFNASPDEYTVIFTPNASGALKLVGESYPFAPGGGYLLTYDNHNSVNGIREFARRKGVTVTYIPIHLPDMRVDENALDAYLDKAAVGAHNLFAYPAQSNYSGVQHPLEWIARAQAKGWDVLLDAAAFVPTNKLDLSKWHPDFVDISFYKMFGYPTGVGCLLAKHTALAKLKRPWFSGGTVEYVSVQVPGHYLNKGYEAFEDGTVNFLNLPAVTIGLQHLDSIGVDVIHARVMALTDWLLTKLVAMRHANGKPLIRVYGPMDTRMRGGIVTINFFGNDGQIIDWSFIEDEACKVNISVRTGCFCNPGSMEVISGLTETDLQKMFKNEQGKDYDEYVNALDGKIYGAVRVSLGIASNFADVYQFVQFAQNFIDKNAQMFENTRCCKLRPRCGASC